MQFLFWQYLKFQILSDFYNLFVGCVSTSAVTLKRNVICCETDEKYIGMILKDLLEKNAEVEDRAWVLGISMSVTVFVLFYSTCIFVYSFSLFPTVTI